MDYALLGNTGLIVSRLAFGAMNFTAGYRSLKSIFKTEAEEAERLVGTALDAGITFFDTANTYAGGESEQMLGKALASRRDEVVIATKVGIRNSKALLQAGLSRQHILWSVEQSLRRLGTDRIDVLICHKEDPFTPLEETLDALDAVVRAGKVRYIGNSNWAGWKTAAAIELQKANGWARFCHSQMSYSLVARDIERDIIPMMRHYGLGLTAWSPMAGGFLTGKYHPDTIASTENRYTELDLLPFDKAAAFALVEQMRGIAEAHDASVAQVALAWVLARPGVTSVIVGASRASQLEDNLGAIDLRLDPAAIAALDAAMPPPDTYPAWFAEKMMDRTTADAVGAGPDALGATPQQQASRQKPE